MQRETLEQQRSRNAWECSRRYKAPKNQAEADSEDPSRVAKGLPALIMNAGLLQVLAFCNKKEKAYAEIATDLRTWIIRRFPDRFGREPSLSFEQFMKKLIEANQGEFQQITREALEWLKWLRVMASTDNQTGKE